jgi:hypothetical protein
MPSCVILQPSYIPWRGYFHQIIKSDIFVFYDDVQYDKRGWRNRNRIKTPRGTQWLTIPVHSHGAQIDHIPINHIRISWDRPWNEEHWRTIEYAYRKAPYFSKYAPSIHEFFTIHVELLADFTIETTIRLARLLDITHTRFIRSSSLEVEGRKTDRLINILKVLDADHYISGPSARDYIEPQKFEKAGIDLEFMEYNYPEYPQLYPPYDPQVSILDLLFNTGPEAVQYIHRSDNVGGKSF